MSEQTQRATSKNNLKNLVSSTQDSATVRRALETTARMQQAYESNQGSSITYLGRNNSTSSAHDPSLYDPALLAKVKEKYAGFPNELLG